MSTQYNYNSAMDLVEALQLQRRKDATGLLSACLLLILLASMFLIGWMGGLQSASDTAQAARSHTHSAKH